MTMSFLMRQILLTWLVPVLLCGAIVSALEIHTAKSNSPAPEPVSPRCFATLGNTSQYSGFTSAVVQLAVDTAGPGALVKVAGTCAGVQARGGTTQSVLITQPLTLQGGYTTSNWITADPAVNLTLLDAGGLGQVIYATDDLTVADLTVQNGWVTCAVRPGCSVYYNKFYLGGGIYAGAGLTLSQVNVLSNTAVCDATCFGGGVFAAGATHVTGGTFQNNLCSAKALTCAGGGMWVTNTVSLTGTRFISNTAGGGSGGLGAITVTLSGGLFQDNQCVSSFCVGGGMLALNTFAITHTRFLNNLAMTAGGAVAGFGAGSIHQSCITGNHADGVYGMSNTQTIDATYNWWGAPDGPPPAGHGDQIDGNVNATPYLTTPVGACLFSETASQLLLPVIMR